MSKRCAEQDALRATRKEVVRIAGVSETETRIERLANLLLIEDFNKRVRKFKSQQPKKGRGGK